MTPKQALDFPPILPTVAHTMAQQTYHRGDPHPTDPGRTFIEYKDREKKRPRWTPPGSAPVAKPSYPVGLKRGDPHPSGDGRSFLQYNDALKRHAQWATPAQLAKKLARTAAWKRNNPDKAREHSRAHTVRTGPDPVDLLMRQGEAMERAHKKAQAAAWKELNKTPQLTEDEKRKRRDRGIEASRRERAKVDKLFALKRALRRNVATAFYRKRVPKDARTEALLGCTFAEASSILESRFLPGMTWENRKEWHIDHRVPVSYAATVEELCRLNHIDNLWPLWAADNMKKRATVPDDADLFLGRPLPTRATESTEKE